MPFLRCIFSKALTTTSSTSYLLCCRRGFVARSSYWSDIQGKCMRRTTCTTVRSLMETTRTGRGDLLQGKRHHANHSEGKGVDAMLADMPTPPHPLSYVPPAEREPNDPSLDFLKGGRPVLGLQVPKSEVLDPGQEEGGGRDSVRPALGPGQQYAPEHRARSKPPKVYMDADAARVQSSSVYAGRPILQPTPSVGMDEYHYSSAEGSAEQSRIPFSSSRALPLPLARGTEHSSAAPLRTGKPPEKAESIFSPEHRYANLNNEGDGMSGAGSSVPRELPLAQQLELDVKKLEYYQGTPKFAELLSEFREKYKDYDADACELGEGPGGQGGPSRRRKEPVDYQHVSPKLRAQLTAGPHGYHPVSLLEQQGLSRFQGYAFPPSLELGKLKSAGDLARLQDSYKSKGLLARLRSGFNALAGRPDSQEEYLATQGCTKEDTHILYRTLGLDAVQRRQMRFMLSDFDRTDRNIAFHVMMSYPYTDWLHVFFMVFVGWWLYQLQLRFDAYEFYDEYLGLDLRQVPSLKKPFLVVVTAVVMVFFLFQPLMLASIATNRAYRIVMKRPIGPP